MRENLTPFKTDCWTYGWPKDWLPLPEHYRVEFWAAPVNKPLQKVMSHVIGPDSPNYTEIWVPPLKYIPWIIWQRFKMWWHS